MWLVLYSKTVSTSFVETPIFQLEFNLHNRVYGICFPNIGTLFDFKTRIYCSVEIECPFVDFIDDATYEYLLV